MLNTITEFIVKYLGNPTHISNIYLLVGIGIVFAIYEALWRRWFGGANILKPKWLNKRGIKHVINIIALFSVCYWIRGLVWYWSLYVAIIIQVIYWTLTFGMYFDIGRNYNPPSEQDIKDYNKPWFSCILNYCFPEHEDKTTRYTPFYDYCGMLTRFTYPMALIFFVPTFNSGIMLCGLWVATAYGIGWVNHDYGRSFINKIGPTEFGEYMSGLFTGWMMVICGMI